MKKLLTLGLMLGFIGSAHAFTETREINSSSHTFTNEQTAHINLTGPNTDFRGAIVSSPTAGGTCTIYDSSATANSTLAVISLGTVQNDRYNVRLSSGLTYSCTSNAGGISIQYHVN